jgi:hypothetical protein
MQMREWSDQSVSERRSRAKASTSRIDSTHVEMLGFKSLPGLWFSSWITFPAERTSSIGLGRTLRRDLRHTSRSFQGGNLPEGAREHGRRESLREFPGPSEEKSEHAEDSTRQIFAERNLRKAILSRYCARPAQGSLKKHRLPAWP